MVAIIALIYVVSLVLAASGLVHRRLKSTRWAIFIILNILLLILAYLTSREGYQADASGTAGSGSRLPLAIGVGIIALIYNLVLFARRKTKKA